MAFLYTRISRVRKRNVQMLCLHKQMQKALSDEQRERDVRSTSSVLMSKGIMGGVYEFTVLFRSIRIRKELQSI